MEDRCIICGEIIPEGRWVCPSCESEIEEGLGKLTKKLTKPPIEKKRMDFCKGEIDKIEKIEYTYYTK